MVKRSSKRRPQSVPPKLRWIVATLIFVGVAATGIRVWLSKTHVTGERGSAWVVTVDVRLQDAKRGATVTLAPPWDKPSARLYSQQLTLDGLQLRRTRRSRHGQRRDITMVATRHGELALNAEFSIHRFATNHRRQPEKTALEADERQHYLSEAPGIDTRAPAVQNAVERIVDKAQGQDDLIERIFDYVRNHTTYSAQSGASTAAAAILKGRANNLGRARAMTALCRAARFPARVVTGFELAEQSEARPLYWVQVYHSGRWTDYDPTQGFDGVLPDNYVAFSRNGPLIAVEGASILDESYQISEVDVPTSIAGAEHSNPLSILDLSRLPLSARATLATLLLLPLGALLNTFVRSVVGVETFGTFTPAMLALAAIYVDWLTATVIFAVVGIIALFGRATLPGLKLVRAPRLTIVFALVALAMALAISLMAYFDLLTGPQVVLLPIVILTSLVDRIYTVVDEQGLHAALVRLLWTGITAVGCFFILTSSELGEWLVKYPEAHLVTIALVVAFAAYRGPKLARFPTLRWLGTLPARKKSDDEE